MATVEMGVEGKEGREGPKDLVVKAARRTNASAGTQTNAGRRGERPSQASEGGTAKGRTAKGDVAATGRGSTVRVELLYRGRRNKERSEKMFGKANLSHLWGRVFHGKENDMHAFYMRAPDCIFT